MQRLIASAILLATVVTPLQAQQKDFSYYSICGDVAAPRTYRWSRAQPVFLRDLLIASRSEFASGRALVLRGPELDFAAVEQIVPAHPYQGTPLRNGDIIVFQSDTATTAAANALIAATSIPDIQPIPLHGMSIDQLLPSGTLPAANQVRVIRCQDDDPATLILSSTDRIFHGDVVLLGEALAAIGVDATTLPLQYDQQPEGLAATQYATTQLLPSFNTMAGADSTDRPLASLTIPGGESLDGMPLSDGNSTDQSSDSTLTASQSVDLNPDFKSGQMELRVPTGEDSAGKNLHGTPVRAVSLESQFPSTQDATAGSLSTANAGAAQENAGWNALFISGLLIAMGLITVGWFRTQQEREMETKMQETLRDSISEAPSQSAPRRAVPEPPTDLLSTFETVGDDTAVLSAGMEADAQAPEIDESSSVEQGLTDAAWFGEGEASEHHVDTTRQAAQTAGTTEDIGDSASESPETQPESWSHLEDLIQNRLPVELTELELPLRVNLFGRPAGPKRLRIDAAHSEIAAPHMLRKGARKKGQQPASTARSKSQNHKPLAPNAASQERSGLDKALNYLEEQADS